MIGDKFFEATTPKEMMLELLTQYDEAERHIVEISGQGPEARTDHERLMAMAKAEIEEAFA